MKRQFKPTVGLRFWEISSRFATFFLFTGLWTPVFLAI